MKAMIAGGGIAGLAAGIALARFGIRVTVFERAPELCEVGAGLTLWPNAIQALRALGLADEVLAASVPVTASRLLTSKGKLLFETRNDELTNRYGAGFICVHRAELQACLLRALGRERTVLNAAVTAFEDLGASVVVDFSDGRQQRADLLVGADGIASTVRAQLLDDGPPRYAGFTAWRGIVSLRHDRLQPGLASVYWGRGSEFGIVPMSQGRVYWFGTRNAPPGERDAPGGRKREVRERFRGWPQPIADLIEATPEETMLRNDILDRPPAHCWTRGRVTLVGDAAHPMMPNLGQGACQALEDAVVLGGCLAGGEEPVKTLEDYERIRRRRADLVVRLSRRDGGDGTG